MKSPIGGVREARSSAIRRSLGLVTALAMAVGTAARPAELAAQTASRVIVVTLDGMRWQEIFGGAERELLTGAAGGVHDTGWTAERFWRATAAERRRVLMPFFWGTIATRGQVWGDSTVGSPARVTNGKRFSYPGYNELFTGRADQRIASNDKIPNPNRTVLEVLATRPGFERSIEVFGSWDVFPFIFSIGRSRIPLNADGPPFPTPSTPAERAADDIAEWLPRHWRGVRLDAPTMAAALAALQTRRPRVLVVLLGETDEWAHERRYDLYLDAAQRADRFIERLWQAAQALPEYAGRTSLLLATDHGRGNRAEWFDHGNAVPAADRIWVAALGPRISGLGVRRGAPATQSQFAATIAALLDERWPDGASALDFGR